jgi:hypothetical protein
MMPEMVRFPIRQTLGLDDAITLSGRVNMGEMLKLRSGLTGESGFTLLGTKMASGQMS